MYYFIKRIFIQNHEIVTYNASIADREKWCDILEIKLDAKAVGARIKKYRKKRDMTQEDLFYKTGLSKQYISELERGTKEGRLSVYYNIAMALEIPLDSLVSDEIDLTDVIFSQTILHKVGSFNRQQRKLLTDIIEVIENNK